MKKFITIINIIFIFIFNNNQAFSKDAMIFADDINKDEFLNIIAEGDVKIINDANTTNEEIISSSKIFIDEENDKIILENDFVYMDRYGNYYYGSKGEFSKDFNEGTINDFKYFGANDNLRLVGKKAIKKGNVDIIEKGVTSVCKTIKLFNCPLWQIKAEKLVHDKDDLLVYQKHSRLEILNFPVFYTPYSITPSPLRKERKSGFLYPTFTFINTKNGFNAKLPYYFNISPDKELLLIPVFYIADNKQSVEYLYSQKTSGGKIDITGSTLTNFNEREEFEWLQDASIGIKVSENINENFQSGFDINLQTSGKYLREYNPTNPINHLTSLKSTAYLDGYSLLDKEDILIVEAYNFQSVRNSTDSKKIPIVAPIIKYNTGNKTYFDKINLQNKFLFYNIYRDKNTEDHAYRQSRFNYDTNLNYQKLWKSARFKFESIIQFDFYSTHKKQIGATDISNGNDFVSEEHYRVFPMSGILIDNPLISKNETIYIPKFFIGLNGSNNNTNEISNELTTDNEIDISRYFSVNRYTGNDKFDNGQRVGYGLDIERNKFKNYDKQSATFSVVQGFQISNESDYGNDVNMTNNFSDVVGSMGVSNITDTSLSLSYNYRYTPEDDYIYYQGTSLSGKTLIGNYSIGYTNANDRSTSLSFGDRENITFNYTSIDFAHSKVKFSSSYDLISDEHQTSTLDYSYSDECLALHAVYNRNFFIDTPDTLTLSMNFAFIGPVPGTIIDQILLSPLDFNEE